MNIKDFNVGDTVYTVGNHRYDDNTVQETTVIRVGRKYVYVKSEFYGEEKYEPPYDNSSLYLIESVTWGSRKKLYRNREDINKNRRFYTLKRWLFGEYYAQKHKYTLEQLESAVKALNPNGEYDSEIEGIWIKTK